LLLGYARTSDALNLIKKLGSFETSYYVFDEISAGISNLYNLYYEDESVFDKIKALRGKIFSSMVEKLGYEAQPNETEQTKQLRVLSIRNAMLAEDEQVIKELKRRFEPVLAGESDQIPADIRGPCVDSPLVLSYFG
jgi:hypothetical protein